MLNLDRGFPSVFALVVSPTEDEANAACTVFRHYMEGTRFNVASITGATSLEEEADALVEKYTFVNKKYFTSKVDIVVATPGRLVEHLLSTDGFTLRKLRFLVLDGADRLVDMSWLGDVEKSCSHLHEPDTSLIKNQLGYDNTVILQQPVNKVIFSTSVIENSKKLAALKLKKPVLLYTTVRGMMKATKAMESNKTKTSGKKIMLEKFFEANDDRKALMLLYLMHHLQYHRILCFTKTAETAHSVCALMQHIIGGEKTIGEFSSTHQQETLAKFRNGDIHMLVCTDDVVQGLSVEGVDCVISYDNPQNVDTYLHRVGHMDCVEKTGMAVTFLRKTQIHHFKKEMKEAGRNVLEDMISNDQIKPYRKNMKEALKKTSHLISKE